VLRLRLPPESWQFMTIVDAITVKRPGTAFAEVLAEWALGRGAGSAAMFSERGYFRM
jgi:hypothetical protein